MPFTTESPLCLNILRALQGFASEGILKLIDDEELKTHFASVKKRKALSKLNIFHTKQLLKDGSQRVSVIVDYLVSLASNIYLVRMWVNNGLKNFDFASSIKAQLLETIQSIDQELVLLDARLNGKEARSEKSSALRPPSTNVSLIYLYNKCRPWSPLIEKLMRLIESCIRVSKTTSNKQSYPAQYGYLQHMEIYTKKFSMINEDSYSDAITLRYTRNSALKLGNFHLRFETCFSAFDHFINLLYPAYLEHTLQIAVKSIWHQDNLEIDPDFAKTSCQLSIHHLMQEIQECERDLLVLMSTGVGRSHELNLIKLSQTIKHVINDYKQHTYLITSSHHNNNARSSLQSYLQHGQLTDLLHSFYHSSPSTPANLLYQPIDEHAEEKEKLQQLYEKLKVIVEHNQQQDVGKNNSQQLWRHSFDTFSPLVLEQIALLLQSFLSVDFKPIGDKAEDQQDEDLNDKKSSNVTSKLLFVPQQEQLQQTIIQPLHSLLEQMQRTALHILRQEHQLKSHIAFLQRIFFLSDITIFDSFRALVQAMAIFPSDTEDELRERRTSMFHSLQPSLAAVFEEHRPKKGIQHFSITIPSLNEVLGMLPITPDDELQDRMLITRSRLSKGCDETILSHALTLLHMECHYTWPLSTLFSQPILSRLGKCQRILLQIFVAKWHVEAWWKAFVSTPSKRKESKKNPGITPKMLSPEQQEYEYEIQRSKRLCQQVIVSIQSLVNHLAGFLLNFIHSTCFHRLLKQLDRASNISIVQECFADCLENVESLLSVLQAAGLSNVHSKLTAALTELRGALVADYQHASRSHVSLALKIAEMGMDDLNTAHQAFINHVLAWTPDHGHIVSLKYEDDKGEEVEKEFRKRSSPVVERTMEELQMHFYSRRQNVKKSL